MGNELDPRIFPPVFYYDINVLFKKEHPDAKVPSNGTGFDCGYDLYSIENTFIKPEHQIIVETGLSIAFPIGTWGVINPRSGLAARSMISITNTPGTIDPNYRGLLKVILINHSTTETFSIKKGDRIGQILFVPCYKANWIEVDKLPETNRGTGGLGSTGK